VLSKVKEYKYGTTICGLSGCAGANVALSPAMKQELDTLGYTVVHHLADAAWLAAMRELIDAIVERGDSWRTPSGSDCNADRQPGE
jgi:hypothetical protein